MPHSRPQHEFATLAEFDAWAETQPDRWELHDGLAVAMAPERANHVRIKARVWAELDRALQSAGSSCEAFVDGLTIPGPGRRSFIPDVSVLCGAELGPAETRSDRPVILVEVLSPSTTKADHGIKLESYFALPSVQHDLVVDSLERRVVHYARHDDGDLRTTLAASGLLRLDPPGIAPSIDAFYEGTDLATTEP